MLALYFREHEVIEGNGHYQVVKVLLGGTQSSSVSQRRCPRMRYVPWRFARLLIPALILPLKTRFFLKWYRLLSINASFFIRVTCKSYMWVDASGGGRTWPLAFGRGPNSDVRNNNGHHLHGV